MVHGVKRVLECSTKGDPRFSAFNAEVTVFGKRTTIEEAYQMCKRFGVIAPTSIWDLKGKNARLKRSVITHIEINGKKFPKEMLTPWYNMLWYMYLQENPHLVEYAKQFDDFNDMFKGRSVNCQADVIRTYVKQGPEVLEETFKDLLEQLVG